MTVVYCTSKGKGLHKYGFLTVLLFKTLTRVYGASFHLHRPHTIC